MNIRLLKKSETAEASVIVGKNYSKEWQRASHRELKDMFGKGLNKPIYFIAEQDRKILGFAGYIQSWMDYDVYEIFWVNVLPSHQGKGIGKALMNRVIMDIKTKKGSALILLSATPKNAIYYKKNFGFTVLCPSSKGYHLMGLVGF